PREGLPWAYLEPTPPVGSQRGKPAWRSLSECQYPPLKFLVELLPGCQRERFAQRCQAARIARMILAKGAIKRLQQSLLLHEEAEISGLGVVHAFERSTEVSLFD